MLEMICKTAGSLSSKITLIVGFDKESIISESKKFNFDISTCEQSLPIGTGDAVKCGINEVDKAHPVDQGNKIQKRNTPLDVIYC